MGPRPDGRGTNPSSVKPLTISYRLQWGRDRMAAERRATGEVGSGLRDASMGPRPDGRGTRARPQAARGARWLQWGRDRMAAERLSAMPGAPQIG